MPEIKVELDRASIRQLEKKIKGLSVETPKLLKTALNETAKKTKTQIATKTREEYIIKSGKIKEAIKHEYATTENLQAILKVKGKREKLDEFKTKANTKKVGAKAQVKKDSSLKELISSYGGRAFKVNFSSGHSEVIQRQGKERLPLKSFRGPAAPQMVGNENVYGELEPKIEELLKQQIERQINRVLTTR